MKIEWNDVFGVKIILSWNLPIKIKQKENGKNYIQDANYEINRHLSVKYTYLGVVALSYYYEDVAFHL